MGSQRVGHNWATFTSPLALGLPSWRPQSLLRRTWVLPPVERLRFMPCPAAPVGILPTDTTSLPLQSVTRTRKQELLLRIAFYFFINQHKGPHVNTWFVWVTSNLGSFPCNSSGAMLKTEKLEQISIQGLLFTKHQRKCFMLFNTLGNSAVDIIFKFFKTVFKGYFPFTVIAKYWLCSLCYTITSLSPLE